MNSFEQNREDLEKISIIQQERLEASNEILFGKPTIEEIENWFNQHDFIDDKTTLEIITANNAYLTNNIDSIKEFEEIVLEEYLKDDMRTKLTLQVGSEIIIKNVLENRGIQIADEELTDIYDLPSIARRIRKLDDYIEQTKSLDLGEDEAKKLTLAAEMLLMGSTVSMGILAPEGEEFINTWSMNNRTRGLEILKNNLEKIPEIWKDSIESRYLYVKNMNIYYTYGITTNYYLLNHANNIKKIDIPKGFLMEDRKHWLNSYINDIEKVFLGPNNVNGKNILRDQKIPKSTRKGLTHETMWMIDLMMLREFENLDFAIYASTQNADRPLIGKPKLNHGFDVTLSSLEKDTHLRFQLKSALSRTPKEYDPSIFVLYEQNFNQDNQAEIRRRIEAYRNAINSNFAMDTKEEAEKHYLPTTLEAAETYKKYKPVSELTLKAIRKGIKIILKTSNPELLSAAKESNIPIINLNRSERRRFEVQDKRKNGNKEPLIRRNPRPKK